MEKLRGDNKYALIIFLLMLILTGALVFVAVFLLPQVRDMNLVFVGTNNELVNVPRVFSTVVSDDGSEHVITVDFTLAVDESVRRNLDVRSIEVTITNAIEGLSHDRINSVGGMEYIKTEVIRELGAHIDPEDFRGLFIRNIVRDDNPTIRHMETFNILSGEDVAEPEPRSNLQEFFSGLGWSRN